MCCLFFLSGIKGEGDPISPQKNSLPPPHFSVHPLQPLLLRKEGFPNPMVSYFHFLSSWPPTFINLASRLPLHIVLHFLAIEVGRKQNFFPNFLHKNSAPSPNFWVDFTSNSQTISHLVISSHPYPLFHHQARLRGAFLFPLNSPIGCDHQGGEEVVLFSFPSWFLCLFKCCLVFVYERMREMSIPISSSWNPKGEKEGLGVTLRESSN